MRISGTEQLVSTFFVLKIIILHPQNFFLKPLPFMYDTIFSASLRK